MPDDNLDFNFQSELELALSTEGVEDVISALNHIVQFEKDAIKSAKDLVKKYGSLKNAANSLAKAYKDSGAASKKSLTATNKQLLKMRRNLRTIISPLKEAGAGFKKLAMPSSFGSALKTVDNYNKSMLSLSSSVSRLGIGINKLEGGLGRIGKETSLTRVETNKLFNDFQSGMRSVSIRDFESIMNRVRDTVGSNAEAISKMNSSLAELSQSFPSLSMALTRLGDSERKATEAEKGALKTRVRNLYLIGQISDAQYKQVAAYINGNRQIGKQDSQRKKDIDAQVKAIKDFQRQWENVSMAVGQILIPHMGKMAEYVKNAFEWTEKWLGSTKKIGVAIAAAMAVGGLAKVGGGMLTNLAMGKLGGMGRGRGGGVGGGILGSMTGGTRVFVTNWPGMMGGITSRTGGFRGPPTPLGMGTAGKSAKLLSRARGIGTGALAIGGGLALGAGGWKLGDVSKDKAARYKTEGKGGRAYGMEVLGNVSMIAGSGAGGAAIGARYGGAPGALIGAAAGLIAGTVVAGIDSWTGKREKEAKKARRERGQFGREFEKEESAANKEADRQKAIVAANKKNLAAAGKEGIGSVYGRTKKTEAEAQEAYDLAVKTGEYEEKRKTLNLQGAKLAEAKSKYDRESANMTDAQKQGADAYLKKQQEQYDTAKKQLEIEERKDPILQSSLAALEQASGEAEKMLMLSQKQKDVMADIGALRQAQAAYMDASIQKMALMGQIEGGEIGKHLKTNLNLIEAEAEAAAEVAKILQSGMSVEDQKKAMAGGSKEVQILYKGLETAGFIGEDQIKTAKALAEVQTIMVNKENERTEAVKRTLKAYNIEIKQTGLLATQAGQLVQLADNYALGVGASAEARVRAFAAEEKAITVLEDQLAQLNQQRVGHGDSNELRNEALGIENEILNRQIAQAQQVRALRDGWVSAISAMNTGAGGFTDIVMTQTKSLALAQKMSGSVQAQILGSRGAGEGFNVSERFQARGSRLGKASVVGRRGREYKSPFSFGPDLSGFERGKREDVQGLINEMRRGGRDIAAGGASALGAGNKMALGAWMEGKASSGGVTNVRNDVTIKIVGDSREKMLRAVGAAFDEVTSTGR